MKVVVTAGPTREAIDPVRFISNYSTGEMGYRIAEEAQRRGNEVVLISGPTSLKRPKGLKLIEVESALQMYAAVKGEARDADCVIASAAVSDYRPVRYSPNKIRSKRARLALSLKQNPDILAQLGKRKAHRVLVGFALESGSGVVRRARRKLKEKNLDIIVANRVSKRRGPEAGYDAPFGRGPTDVFVIDKKGGVAQFEKIYKEELAGILLDRITEMMQ